MAMSPLVVFSSAETRASSASIPSGAERPFARRGRGFCGMRARIERMTSFEASLSAGNTPRPAVAAVSNSGAPSQLSSALIVETGIVPGRSRLLY